MKEQITEGSIFLPVFKLRDGTCFVEGRDICGAALSGAHELRAAGADEDVLELARKVLMALCDSLFSEGVAIRKPGTDEYYEAVLEWRKELEISQ